MSGDTAVAAVALLMCAVLVGAGVRHRGGLVANARSAVIWAAIIIGLALVVTWFGWDR